MSEKLGDGPQTTEQFVTEGEINGIFIRVPGVEVRSRGYIPGLSGYRSPGTYIGGRYFPGSYIPGTPGYYYNEVPTKEFPISDKVTLHLGDPISSNFEARFRLRIEMTPGDLGGKLLVFATSADEEKKRAVYYDPDGEEIGEEEFYEKSEYNDEYWEDEESLGVETTYNLHFAPPVAVSGGIEAHFNIPDANIKNTLHLFLPKKIAPLDSIRGTEIVQALKNSVMNNDPNHDIDSLQAWQALAENLQVPPQTRIVVVSALEEYKVKYPQAAELFK